MNEALSGRLIIAFFLILGLGLTAYKWHSGFPLLPDQKNKLWVIEATLSFDSDDSDFKAEITKPNIAKNFDIVKSYLPQQGVTTSIKEVNGNERIVVEGKGHGSKRTLTYQINGFFNEGQHFSTDAPKDDILQPSWNSKQIEAANVLIKELKPKHKNLDAFIIDLVNTGMQVGNDSPLAELVSQESIFRYLIDLLNVANIHTRSIKGINLNDGVRNSALTIIIEAWDGKKWTQLDPLAPGMLVDKNFLSWQFPNEPIYSLEGGINSNIRFSTLSNTVSVGSLAILDNAKEQSIFSKFSLYILPINQQNSFKLTLMVPLGVLLVSLLRIIVGIKSSGTFMPVLLALAFMETSWLNGMVVFLSIVAIGLVIRSLMDWLDMLLVARISVVVTMVIIIMLVLDVFGYISSPDSEFKTSYFPIIIMAWTIERMSILWEEEGPKEVFQQGGGSLLIASLCYLVMTFEITKHLMYNFPALVFVIVACLIWLGRYTGYRLTELYRFRDMQ